ncbi:hypothetical protein TNCV_5059231 [Trichonephila clavipes]|nr:hypothetical protein TNCV_5059231 [Trichonephila clavipes]
MKKTRKTPAGFDSPIALSEEFLEIYDDNARTAPLRADKDISEFVQSSKNVIDADSDSKRKMNKVASVFPHHPK